MNTEHERVNFENVCTLKLHLSINVSSLVYISIYWEPQAFNIYQTIPLNLSEKLIKYIGIEEKKFIKKFEKSFKKENKVWTEAFEKTKFIKKESTIFWNTKKGVTLGFDQLFNGLWITALKLSNDNRPIFGSRGII